MSESYLDDADLYLEASREFELGKTDPALWAKALALNGGDEDKAKSEYVRIRVHVLKERANSADVSIPVPTADPNQKSYTEAKALRRGRALDGTTDQEVIESIRTGDLRGFISNGIWYLEEEEPQDPEGSGALKGLANEKKSLGGLSVNHSDSSTFKLLVNGDLGLARTYWLYGVFVGLLFGVAANIFAQMGEVAASGLVAIFSLIYGAIVLCGVWRASKKYEGPGVWRVLAQIATVLGALQILLAAFVLLASGLT